MRSFNVYAHLYTKEEIYHIPPHGIPHADGFYLHRTPNRISFLSLSSSLCARQLACYDGGERHYKAHLDASLHSVWSVGLLAWLRQRMYRQRTITAILYLNETQWDCKKEVRRGEGRKRGGALFMYLGRFGVLGGRDCLKVRLGLGSERSRMIVCQRLG